MNNPLSIKHALLFILAFTLLGSSSVFAGENDHHQSNSHQAQGDNHDDHSEHEEEVHGPKGGRLLQTGELSIEVTIFENGVPPEMRLYAYKNGKPLDPSQLQVSVHLDRLGSEDNITFTPEADYLLGNQVIAEPHSFDVKVEAQYQGKPFDWHYQSFEGRSTISPRQLELAGVKTASAGPQTLHQVEKLFGVIAAVDAQIYRLNAPYPSLVEKIHVNVGDQVKQGQVLATLRNIKTLQSYALKSPSNGEVTHRPINAGERVDMTALLTITDLSNVWVEMSAFPEAIEKLAIGQTVEVRDLHQHEVAVATLTYIAPEMTGGHIARARATIANPNGHWRPGMHVKAAVTTAKRQVELAVATSSLQSFREMPVVFARFGNTFEVRMLEMGERDDQYIEVLGGLEAGTEYVTENSFLIKADILKSGAAHAH